MKKVLWAFVFLAVAVFMGRMFVIGYRNAVKEGDEHVRQHMLKPLNVPEQPRPEAKPQKKVGEKEI